MEKTLSLVPSFLQGWDLEKDVLPVQKYAGEDRPLGSLDQDCVGRLNWQPMQLLKKRGAHDGFRSMRFQFIFKGSFTQSACPTIGQRLQEKGRMVSSLNR